MNQITQVGAALQHRMLFGRSYEIPSIYYLAVMSVKPVSFIGGNELVEPPPFDLVDGVSTNYMRAEIPNTPGFWAVDESGAAYTTTDIEFASAAKDWGDLRFWALCNTDSSGDVLYIGEFNAPVTIATGDILRFPAGSIKIQQHIETDVV